MRNQTHRRATLFGFAVVATVVTMTSTAFACIKWAGKMTATGATGMSTTSNGDPAYDHKWCNNAGPTAAAGGPMGSSVKIVVSPGTCSVLAAGRYRIDFNAVDGYTFNGSSWAFASAGGVGCYTSTVRGVPPRAPLGIITVDASGKGQATVPLLVDLDATGSAPGTYKSGPNKAGVLCIGKVDNVLEPGNFVPFQVL